MSVQPKISESEQIAEQTAPGVSGPAHTPTPWSIAASGRLVIREVPGLAEDCDHYSVAVLSSHSLVGLEEACANAAFIVSAVNFHGALVKALEDIAAYSHSQFAVDRARGVLASLREAQP